MNQVHLIGNITREIELRESAAGTKYVQFTIAVNSGVKKIITNYIDIVAFNKYAEQLATVGKKGTKLCVDGHLNQAQYMDHEGNTRNSLKVILESFSVINKKSEVPDQGEEVAASTDEK